MSRSLCTNCFIIVLFLPFFAQSQFTVKHTDYFLNRPVQGERSIYDDFRRQKSIFDSTAEYPLFLPPTPIPLLYGFSVFEPRFGTGMNLLETGQQDFASYLGKYDSEKEADMLKLPTPLNLLGRTPQLIKLEGTYVKPIKPVITVTGRPISDLSLTGNNQLSASDRIRMGTARPKNPRVRTTTEESLLGRVGSFEEFRERGMGDPFDLTEDEYAEFGDKQKRKKNDELDETDAEFDVQNGADGKIDAEERVKLREMSEKLRQRFVAKLTEQQKNLSNVPEKVEREWNGVENITVPQRHHENNTSKDSDDNPGDTMEIQTTSEGSTYTVDREGQTEEEKYTNGQIGRLAINAKKHETKPALENESLIGSRDEENQLSGATENTSRKTASYLQQENKETKFDALDTSDELVDGDTRKVNFEKLAGKMTEQHHHDAPTTKSPCRCATTKKVQMYLVSNDSEEQNTVDGETSLIVDAVKTNKTTTKLPRVNTTIHGTASATMHLVKNDVTELDKTAHNGTTTNNTVMGSGTLQSSIDKSTIAEGLNASKANTGEESKQFGKGSEVKREQRNFMDDQTGLVKTVIQRRPHDNPTEIKETEPVDKTIKKETTAKASTTSTVTSSTSFTIITTMDIDDAPIVIAVSNTSKVAETKVSSSALPKVTSERRSSRPTSFSSKPTPTQEQLTMLATKTLEKTTYFTVQPDTADQTTRDQWSEEATDEENPGSLENHTRKNENASQPSPEMLKVLHNIANTFRPTIVEQPIKYAANVRTTRAPIHPGTRMETLEDRGGPVESHADVTARPESTQILNNTTTAKVPTSTLESKTSKRSSFDKRVSTASTVMLTTKVPVTSESQANVTAKSTTFVETKTSTRTTKISTNNRLMTKLVATTLKPIRATTTQKSTTAVDTDHKKMNNTTAASVDLGAKSILNTTSFTTKSSSNLSTSNTTKKSSTTIPKQTPKGMVKMNLEKVIIAKVNALTESKALRITKPPITETTTQITSLINTTLQMLFRLPTTTTTKEGLITDVSVQSPINSTSSKNQNVPSKFPNTTQKSTTARMVNTDISTVSKTASSTTTKSTDSLTAKSITTSKVLSWKNHITSTSKPKTTPSVRITTVLKKFETIPPNSLLFL